MNFIVNAFKLFVLCFCNGYKLILGNVYIFALNNDFDKVVSIFLSLQAF